MDQYTRLLLRAIKQIKKSGQASFKTLRELNEYTPVATFMRDIRDLIYTEERFAHG